MILIDFNKAYFMGEAFDLTCLERPEIAYQIVVPTQVVLLDSDERPLPRIARIYATNLYRLWDQIRTYEQWSEEVKFFASLMATKLLMMEIWEDHGDDGHVDFRFEGTYRFWLESEFIDGLTNARRGDAERSVFQRFFREPC